MRTLAQYIPDWQNLEGIKPKNEQEFIDLFLPWIEQLKDCRDFTFDGEGSYFGNQISIVEGSAYFGGKVQFEISYSKEIISIYRNDHYGYWVPEYVYLKAGMENFDKIKHALYKKLMWAFGLNELAPLEK